MPSPHSAARVDAAHEPGAHEPGAIEIRGLTKQFGPITAVDDLSFQVQPGRVTGFLGPNGSGKTTTLRMLLGLTQATSGTATIGGVRYRDLPDPLTVVGASLEASSFHPGRTAYDHLRVYAPMARATDARCREVLAYVGLEAAAKRRVGGYSLGMRQRLALAQALLGDPRVLLLDEPANGLDPEGIRWLRELLRALATEGRTVLISSHMLGEVQQTVDDVVIIAKGRLRYASSLVELAQQSVSRVRVASPDASRLDALARERGWIIEHSGAPAATGAHATLPASGPLRIDVIGVPAHEIGAAAFTAGVQLFELADATTGLEEVFLQIVADEPVAPTVGSHA